jgi:hypothetical protein
VRHDPLGRLAVVSEQPRRAQMRRRPLRRRGADPREAVVIVDEAGTMPTHAMERLLVVIAVRGRPGAVTAAGARRKDEGRSLMTDAGLFSEAGDGARTRDPELGKLS